MWNLVNGGRMPGAAPFDVLLPAHCRDNLMILERLPGDDYTYRHYGQTIARHAGFDMTGKKVSDFKGALGSFYAEIYARALTTRMPIVTVHRLGHFRERPLWERVVLPVGDADGVSAIYVLNHALDIEIEASLIHSTNPSAGLIALQFERDPQGEIANAIIVGANRRARDITGRRLDEMLGKPMVECFPGIVAAGLWDAYLKAAAARAAVNITLTYDADRVSGDFNVIIAPFHDGVTIEFSAAQP